MKTRLVIFFLALSLLGIASAVQAQTSKTEAPAAYAGVPFRLNFSLSDRPPPLPIGRKVAQFLVGSGTGIITGAMGGVVGYGLSTCNDEDDAYFCGLGGIALGVSVGYVFGSSLGVYAVGYDEEASGRFSFTLLGGIGGAVLSGLVLSGLEEDLNLVVLLAGPTLGAMAVNNLTRRYRSPSQQTGLLNLDRSGFALGVPAVSLTRLADPHRTVARSIRLFTASW